MSLQQLPHAKRGVSAYELVPQAGWLHLETEGKIGFAEWTPVHLSRPHVSFRSLESGAASRRINHRGRFRNEKCDVDFDRGSDSRRWFSARPSRLCGI